MTIKIFTIGFTQKKAESFFLMLKEKKIKKVLDTRLNNVSQLAGFTKKEDLAFFLKVISEVEYEHNLTLAPTQDILDEYKKKTFDWNNYEKKFFSLLADRKIEKEFKPEDLNHACFLCSEAEPHHCHRRLVAEYLQSKWKNVEIEHLI